MLGKFEAALMRMLIDKFGAGPDEVCQLLATERIHGGALVTTAVRMKLADGARLCHLLCQYWEKPFFDLSFPYRRFLSHAHRPIDELLDIDLLPLEIGPDEITVVGCYVPEQKCMNELSRQLGKPIILLLAEAERVAEALLRLRERTRRLADARTCDCGTDKKRFIKVTRAGWPALVRETFAGSVICIEFNRAGTLSKTVESLDPSEPPQLVNYLVGKTMLHPVKADDDISELINSFVRSIVHFEGELKDAFLRLRVAPMLLDG